MVLDTRVASPTSTEQMWKHLVLSPDVERMWRGTRHTQKLKAPRVPLAFLPELGEYGEHTRGWSGAQLQQSQQAEQESKAQEWDTSTKSEASCADIAEGMPAAVAIHRCHT